MKNNDKARNELDRSQIRTKFQTQLNFLYGFNQLYSHSIFPSKEFLNQLG